MIAFVLSPGRKHLAVGQPQWDPILGVFGAPPMLEPILVGIWGGFRCTTQFVVHVSGDDVHWGLADLGFGS